MGGRRPKAAVPPFWAGRPKAAPPLLAPEAPGPGGLGGGSPPGRPAPQKYLTYLCWNPVHYEVVMWVLVARAHVLFSVGGRGRHKIV